MAGDKVASIMQDVIKEARKHKGISELAGFSRTLFAGALPEDLASYGPKDLSDLAQASLSFIGSRRPGRPKIRSLNLGGAFAHVTIIEIANDDMPFLVDSVLALLNERGHEIRLLLHPVLNLSRDGAGNLVKFEERPSTIANLMRESFMHIHVERLSDAEREALEREIEQVLNDVRTAVLDWSAMRARLKEAIAQYQSNPPPIPADELTESIDFLQWLLDNHFTFLGMREYRFDGGAKKGQLTAVEGSGLGILRKAETQVLRKGGELVSITPEIRAFLMQPAALIITKSDVRANVHRRAAMDYIGVKLFDAKGELAGELRVVGLFTSTAYTRSPSAIPLLRRKIEAVVAASGFNPAGHSGKALINVLESFPRDELFQIDAEMLADMAHGILRLEERPRSRLFVRRDRFDRFVSAFAFIPRDRFNSDVRQRVGEIIAKAFHGKVVSFSPSFGEGTLVRVHFIILRQPGEDPKPDIGELEAEVVEAVRTWDDRLQSEMARSEFGSTAAKWRGAFPAGYRDRVTPGQSLEDIAELEALNGDGSVAVKFAQRRADKPDEVNLRLYHHGDAIPLSSRLPILENMGFKAIEETTFEVVPQGKKAVIHDVVLRAASEGPDIKAAAPDLEATFMAAWNGAVENDAFNALTLGQRIHWRDIALLRSLARYLRQGPASFSAEYMAQTMVKHSSIAHQIVNLFHARFDPGKLDDAKAHSIAQDIEQALQQVPVLDEDRIIRSYCNLVSAIVRTNFFQKKEGSSTTATISVKVDSKKVEGLPEPKPFAEIFVYSPDIEGIHLRFGRIARGGIRWSDRPEDFRTEILGLAKAQNVKNVVIVPVGAKGGFVPRKLPQGASREAIQADGIRAYRSFVSSILDITDNLKGNRTIPPREVVRRDGDDPYLVVAADKGTATFSDIANEISAEHEFWLDDAFASGGSAGYDHKKMAITARGAWEAVRRHFREMNVNIATTPFTAMGIGDMSGDVFGNGMLLSPHIKLVAAFDHRDIFIDPDPDPAKSLAERKRLFALQRSSWQDYDKALISTGGGVYSRGLKSIPLNKQIRKLTGLNMTAATPRQLINALLKSEADLMWLGGIGTYIKSSDETHSEVGDRANDGIRVNAAEVRARVIGEGANLGVSQRGRVEFARRGGRINTDAIDNSGGVNSSDMEVNIKIALGMAEQAGKIDREQRNRLLAEMTDEVAALVLRNNYLQTLSLSLSVARGTEENGYAILLMHDLEKRGLLDRELEALPDDAEIKARDARRETLTRPELAMLFAYAKIALNHDLLESNVPDDEYLSRELMRYFPQRMVQSHAEEIKQHRLRREIVATVLSNSMINRGGPGFVVRLQSETGSTPADIAAAFAVARDSFDFIAINHATDGLDNKIEIALQTRLYLELQALLRRATQWFLRNSALDSGLNDIVSRYRQGIDQLRAALNEYLPQMAVDALRKRAEELRAAGLPEELSHRIAGLAYLQRAPDIVQVATECGATLEAAAKVLYASGAQFDIDGVIRRAEKLVAKDFFERLAINRTIDQVFLSHRAITRQVLDLYGTSHDPWSAWAQAHGERINIVLSTLSELLAEKDFDLAKLSVAQGLLSDLAATRA
jgi:glutamate dehydrogenase